MLIGQGLTVSVISQGLTNVKKFKGNRYWLQPRKMLPRLTPKKTIPTRSVKILSKNLLKKIFLNKKKVYNLIGSYHLSSVTKS